MTLYKYGTFLNIWIHSDILHHWTTVALQKSLFSSPNTASPLILSKCSPWHDPHTLEQLSFVHCKYTEVYYLKSVTWKVPLNLFQKYFWYKWRILNLLELGYCSANPFPFQQGSHSMVSPLPNNSITWRLLRTAWYIIRCRAGQWESFRCYKAFRWIDFFAETWVPHCR